MTFTETIPFVLPADSSERLLAVADALEKHPEQWDQRDFILTEAAGPDLASDYAGSGIPECGTTLCTGGWAVVLTPKEELAEYSSWEDAGAVALGIDTRLAEYLFYQIGDPDDGSDAAIRAIMPNVLRALAGLPEARRRFDNPLVQEILAPFDEID